uniref:Uncharacterized protein n=1 Tax=Myoviridae sp. ctdWz11 TaxID=2826671 RepID=A0A8S5NQ92_9CAUD|nr:MAG TPA: hypothetical protein [Myoviridae sp. ctdWz11]
MLDKLTGEKAHGDICLYMACVKQNSLIYY